MRIALDYRYDFDKRTFNNISISAILGALGGGITGIILDRHILKKKADEKQTNGNHGKKVPG